MSSYMRMVILLAALAAVACTKDDRVYAEKELDVVFDWAYLGWAGVKFTTILMRL